jgi:hypothetical protein
MYIPFQWKDAAAGVPAAVKAANDATTASLIVLIVFMLLVSLNQGFLLARSTRQA